MKRSGFVLLVIGILLVTSFSFTAADVEYFDAYRATDMNFEVDGEPWQPRDVDGSMLYPIVVNGRSYVPVRSLLEAKGVTVDWRDPTRTIVLDYSTIDLDQPQPFVPLHKKKEIVVVGDLEKEATILYTMNDPVPDRIDMGVTNETILNLAEDVMFYMNEEPMEMTPMEFLRNEKMMNPDNVKLYLDEKGQVFRADFMDEDSDGDGMESRIGIEIEISGPPWKIKIRIKF
ncbi:hypothetical protein SANA_03090 [Gottschalkiaceae bacterium SANA]|nr:hypothetical protein SANA_03090 [Gottschalkiaceae bacterium SANA]